MKKFLFLILLFLIITISVSGQEGSYNFPNTNDSFTLNNDTDDSNTGNSNIIDNSNIEIEPMTFTERVNKRVSLVLIETDYPVTPGDRYLVSYLYSGEKFDLPFYVEDNYTINLAYLGEHNVKNLSFSQFKDKVENEVSAAYPDSVPNVIITEPGSFKVQITGELRHSHLITAWSFDRLSTLLKGRTSEFSSNRYIEILSEDGTSTFYDLFQASRYGNLDHDPYICYGDHIILHPYYKKTNISGEVQYPGTYEILPEDTLEDLIEIYAGGLTTFADTERVTIKRLNSVNKTEGDSFYLDISNSIPEAFELNDFDTVNIAKVLDHRSVVYFQGAVGDFNRGMESEGFSTVSNKVSYPIVNGEKLSSAVRALNGGFSQESDLESAFILRGSDGSKVDVDIQHLLLKGGDENDAVLYDGDIVVIPFRQYIVYVGGQVNNPGAYPYIVNKTYEYYIGLAGGYNINNHLGNRVRITDVYGDRKVYRERIIEPEDVIYAPLNHPMYWLKEYGDDLAVIAASLVSTIIMVNYIGELAGSDPDIPIQ